MNLRLRVKNLKNVIKTKTKNEFQLVDFKKMKKKLAKYSIKPNQT